MGKVKYDKMDKAEAKKYIKAEFKRMQKELPKRYNMKYRGKLKLKIYSGKVNKNWVKRKGSIFDPDSPYYGFTDLSTRTIYIHEDMLKSPKDAEVLLHHEGTETLLYDNKYPLEGKRGTTAHDRAQKMERMHYASGRTKLGSGLRRIYLSIRKKK